MTLANNIFFVLIRDYYHLLIDLLSYYTNNENLLVWLIV